MKRLILKKKRISYLIILVMCIFLIFYFIKPTNPNNKIKDRVVAAYVNKSLKKDKHFDSSISNDNHEIMPLWPPDKNYNTDQLNLKKREYKKYNYKIAFLTFDDGPSLNTPKIVGILNANKIKATFFNVGTRINEYPQFLKMEYDNGNAIGNHTWDHVYLNLYKTPETLLDEATKANDITEQVIGIRTPLFRAPGGTLGNFSIGTWNLMDANNYIIYDWNVSSGDGSSGQLPKSKLIENVLTQSRNKKVAIILMHDSTAKNTTIEALPEIITGLKSEGFSFGILNPDVQPVQFMHDSIQMANIPNQNYKQVKLKK